MLAQMFVSHTDTQNKMSCSPVLKYLLTGRWRIIPTNSEQKDALEKWTFFPVEDYHKCGENPSKTIFIEWVAGESKTSSGDRQSFAVQDLTTVS